MLSFCGTSALLMIVTQQKSRGGFTAFSVRLSEASSKNYMLQTVLSYTLPRGKSCHFLKIKALL